MRSPGKSPRLRKVFRYLAAFFIATLILLFLFKGSLFRWAVNHQMKKWEARTGLTLGYEKAELSGLSRVCFTGFSACNSTGDSLVQVGYLEAGIRPLALVFNGVLFKSVSVREATLRYDRRPAADSSRIDSSGEEPAARIDPGRTIGLLRRLLPKSVELRDCRIIYRDMLGQLALGLDSLESEDRILQGQVWLEDSLGRQNWSLDGTLDQGIELRAWTTREGPLPILNARTGSDLRCDTIRMNIKRGGEGASQLLLSGTVRNFRLYQARLSSDTLGFDFLSANLGLNFREGYLEIDTFSQFTVNRITGTAGVRFPLHGALKQYALVIHTDELPATDFFNSLPRGAFDDTRGIRAGGSLSYHLRFALDGDQPDSLVFESELRRKNFSVKSWGQTNLSRMSGDFIHTVYENNREIRQIPVSAENPKFTPLQEIPQELIHAVLVSEDPSFFHHSGFIPEAFRESIADNYKTRSFKRGGSTISMQLVKNVFLSRKKTVFRKMEEALIVWLIEGQRLTTKDRMLEVYFNIIEWGPGVYGVAEASEFYFNKKPGRLNLAECIYLANIIPRPKKFKYGFEANGELKSYMAEMNRFILRRMVSRELLSPEDTLKYEPKVELRGAARDMVVPDSLDTEPVWKELIPAIRDLFD